MKVAWTVLSVSAVALLVSAISVMQLYGVVAQEVPTESVTSETKPIFASVGLDDLDAILETEAVRDWGGFDRTVQARGAFAADRKEELISLLRRSGFADNADMLFISGDADEWWVSSGPVVTEMKLERSTPAQTDQIKLLKLSDGRHLFQFASAEF